MTLLTTNFSLPKPESTEPPDGPAQIGALADAVDAELDDIAPAQIQDQTAGKLLIANASGVITGTAMSGDVTVSPTGVASIAAGAVDTTELAADAVNALKIADDAVNSSHYAPGSVNSTALGTSAVTNSKLGPDAVNGAKIANGAVDTEHLATDAVNGGKIADDSINSEHYVDGSIDAQHIGNDQVNGTKIADDAINSEHYVDGSIDRVHLAGDVIDSSKLANDSVNSEHYVDGSIDNQHIAAGTIRMDKIYDETGMGVISANTAINTGWATHATVDAGAAGWYLIIISGSFTHETGRQYCSFRCSTPSSSGHAVTTHHADANYWSYFGNSAVLYSSTGQCYFQASPSASKTVLSSGSNITAVRVG